MRKGFGFYSPHEATMFFMKTLLISFWIGVDLIAALLLSTIPGSVLLRHGLLFLCAAAILAAGTVFSGLFAWATGSLFGPRAKTAQASGNAVREILERVRRDPWHLIGAGGAGVAAVLIAATGYLAFLRYESEAMKQTGRADVVIAQKCAEVASLEKQLFHSDQQVVLAQCLLQYDENYASLRKS